MNQNKDYYRILGVLEDAEDIVIKAAYRALAQKYHPDKFDGNPNNSEEKMKEINEAFSILSDPVTRKQYDENRVKAEYENETSEDAEDLIHDLDKDWNEASEYFPDIVQIASTLSIYSKSLEFAYKVILLEEKNFNKRQKVADDLKRSYITKYFGTNKRIQEYAEELFLNNRRDLLQKLNRAVNLLGSDINPELIIDKIDEDYLKSREKEKKEKKKVESRVLAKQLLSASKTDEIHFLSIDFLRSIGFAVHMSGIFVSKYTVSNGDYYEEFNPSSFYEFARNYAKEFLK